MGGLSFKKSMRWRGDAAYSRPLRWLLAVHGSTALPFTYAHLQASSCFFSVQHRAALKQAAAFSLCDAVLPLRPPRPLDLHREERVKILLPTLYTRRLAPPHGCCATATPPWRPCPAPTHTRPCWPAAASAWGWRGARRPSGRGCRRRRTRREVRATCCWCAGFPLCPDVVR